MDQEDSSLLLQVFSSVFEGFAFMFVEDEPEAEPECGEIWVRAEISFKGGSSSGKMDILAPHEFCSQLAENILGNGEELPDGAGDNALKEVLNVSCGYFLAEKFGTGEVFDLTVPEAEQISAEDCSEVLGQGGHISFEVDEHPVLAGFVLEQA